MNKKLCISIAIILFTIFSFTVCFANDGNGLSTATNNVRNFVGGVENTVENAALDVANTSKNVTGGIENGVNNNMNSATKMTTDNNNDGRYSTSRTSTTGTMMGMTSNGWTWLILRIAAIAIIAVVWYYSMQFTNNNKNNND